MSQSNPRGELPLEACKCRELLPCPFCGAYAYYFPYAEGDKAGCSKACYGSTQIDVDVWQSRAASAPLRGALNLPYILEALECAETEMRYAGLNQYKSDNEGQLAAYSKIQTAIKHLRGES